MGISVISYFCNVKTVFILLISTIIAFSSLAQKDNHLGIEFQGRYGLLLAHHEEMKPLVKSPAIGGELSIYFQKNGKSEYDSLYKFPKYGISIIGTSLGNRKVFGQLYGFTLFGDFPFIHTEKDEFSGSMGVGLAFVTKKYDAVTNPSDLALSTHLNALINLSLKYRHFFGNWNIIFALHATHSSNGASRLPNLGVNLVYASVGFGYQFRNTYLPTKVRKINLDKHWHYNIIGVFSVGQVYPIGGKLYPVANLQLSTTKRFTPKSGIEIIADGFLKGSNVDKVLDEGGTALNAIQIGLMGAYNLYLNDHLRIVVGLGHYLYDRYHFNNKMYARLGFKYQINPHLVATLGIKSHWAKADYIEYGIGYTL